LEFHSHENQPKKTATWLVPRAAHPATVLLLVAVEMGMFTSCGLPDVCVRVAETDIVAAVEQSEAHIATVAVGELVASGRRDVRISGVETGPPVSSSNTIRDSRVFITGLLALKKNPSLIRRYLEVYAKTVQLVVDVLQDAEVVESTMRGKVDAALARVRDSFRGDGGRLRASLAESVSGWNMEKGIEEFVKRAAEAGFDVEETLKTYLTPLPSLP
jgi:hypothetical protein